MSFLEDLSRKLGNVGSDISRLPNDPLGAYISITTDPFDVVQKGGKLDIPGMSNQGGSSNKPIDQLTLEDIKKFMGEGRSVGEQLTGATSADIGKNRGDIRQKYSDIVNAPSRGAARVASARNADVKSLRQQQARQGVSGGVASNQLTQMNQDYAGKIGDVRQKEYLDALNKLEAQYRGASSDVMSAEGQYGAIGVGSKPNPVAAGGNNMFDTYLCTELRKRGMISRFELFIIHSLLVIGTLFLPAETIFYFKYGGYLVFLINKEENDWVNIKKKVFTNSFNLIKKFKFISAVHNYEKETRKLFNRYPRFSLPLKELDSKWTIGKVIKSFKTMWRIQNG